MFLKKITSKLMTRAEAPSAAVALAAFGKHPGWDDHVDDMGLTTDLLVSTKRLLYVDGIGGNIDSGSWERLTEDQRLAGFDHAFFWKVGSQLLVGRFWSSRDGKGRTKYPMVVCAQCNGQSGAWAAANVLPVLERLKGQVERSASAADVRATIGSAAMELTRLAVGAPMASAVTPDPGLMSRLAARPEMGPETTGLLRILYQIEREMQAYRRQTGSASGRTRTEDLRPRHLRVPPCADSAGAVGTLWLDFLAKQFDPSAPVAVLIPLGSPWVDLVIGEPLTAQFFCIRANQKSIPLTSEIPYNLDSDFLARAAAMIKE